MPAMLQRPHGTPPTTTRKGHPMTAILTRAGTSSFGATCEECRTTLHSTTKRRAEDWLKRHNNRHHRAPKGASFVSATESATAGLDKP